MDRHTTQDIEPADRRISFLRTSLCSETATHTETEPLDLSQLHKETESEIKEQKTLLRVLQNDKRSPCYYHRLPRELLVQIFQWITHPGDQVNLRRALPGIGDMMKWDSVDLLYFKRIYPLVQDYFWPDWRHIWKLCQVSPEFMDVVLHHFENSLSDIRTVQSRLPLMTCDFVSRRTKEIMANNITAVVDECDALGRTEWMKDMPFLVVFYFNCSLDESQSLSSLSGFLNVHGQKVWAAEVSILMHGGDGSLDKFLNRILTRTRNMVHLQLFVNNNYNAFLRSPDTLPYLPRLRSLHCVKIVSESFIQKYADQLTSLAVQTYSPVVSFRNVSFPELWFYGFRDLSQLDMIQTPLDSVLESPLQSVWLLLTRDYQDIHPLPETLCDLSHFEDTLETLYLDFCKYSTRNWIVEGDEWMSRVRLPKVRHLQLLDYRGKLDWLAVLPSLQTLTLLSYNRRAKADVGERSPDLIYVSTNKITRFHTNIWKKLPNLQQITIQNDPTSWKSSFRVARGEHEAYQNKCWIRKMAIKILAVCLSRDLGNC